MSFLGLPLNSSDVTSGLKLNLNCSLPSFIIWKCERSLPLFSLLSFHTIQLCTQIRFEARHFALSVDEICLRRWLPPLQDRVYSIVFIPNRTFLVRFGGISGEFGRYMVRILARLRLAKIPVVRSNELDMLAKRTKKGAIRYLLYPNSS